MFSLQKPSPDVIQEFLNTQKDMPPSYPEVGATKTETPPEGYELDHYRVQLGSGERVYAHAVKALYDWKMYPSEMSEVFPKNCLVTKDVTIAIAASHLGFWSLNACRVIYKLDEMRPLKRCGFALATLPEHAERGEERFTVEWHSDESVWFEVYAFSKPHSVLAKLGKPLARRVQQRFAEASQQAMITAARRQ